MKRNSILAAAWLKMHKGTKSATDRKTPTNVERAKLEGNLRHQYAIGLLLISSDYHCISPTALPLHHLQNASLLPPSFLRTLSGVKHGDLV